MHKGYNGRPPCETCQREGHRSHNGAIPRADMCPEAQERKRGWDRHRSQTPERRAARRAYYHRNWARENYARWRWALKDRMAHKEARIAELEEELRELMA